MNFIQWCNDDNGFLTAILSLIGLILSATAIVVSIRTARLPYKKRIMLSTTPAIDIGASAGCRYQKSFIPKLLLLSGMSVLATNTGNRTVNLTYLGYAVKKDGEYTPLLIPPYNHEFNSTASLAPSEMFENQFYIDELIKVLSHENPNIKLFMYAKDTEGKKYTKVGDLLNFLSKSKYSTSKHST